MIGTVDAGRRGPLSLAVLLMVLLTAGGCGYTMLKGAAEEPPAAVPEAGAQGLPPGHPPVYADEDWIGVSFLDYLLGSDDPLRFESLRSDPRVVLPAEHAILRLRISVGDIAVADVWQIRVDEFGWVRVSRWMQGGTGPQLDEDLAAEREEFRLDRSSEAALRAMLLALLPLSRGADHRIPSISLHNIPPEMWAYDAPGWIELDYRVERGDLASAADWPGGRIQAPLDLVQLLIGTWDSRPPRELRELIEQLADTRPMLVDLAMLVEGLVLAWEVEGAQKERIGLPLHVGR